MQIISYNVNGIRAAEKKGLSQWLREEQPDIICLQEVKANEDQVDLEVYQSMGYHIYWHSALKKGYSGVAIFTKIKPKHVEYGCGIQKYDAEGRVIRVDFDKFSVICTYMPSGTTGETRQEFKMQWLADFQAYVTSLKIQIPNLLICGDYNICHEPIDIHDPVSNKKSSGFLPEERQWVSDFLKSGFIDSFRHLNKDPDHYTWWSYRAGSRERNKGWRIDYHLISEPLKPYLKDAAILPEVKHSDHCPVSVELNFS